jgi:hypothetical protein
MQKMSRKLESQFQLDRLEKRHIALKQQIAELDQQRYLSVADQVFLVDLKKRKLATKDLLAGLRRRTDGD